MSFSSRPLSPHLGVYRWSITMALSILHRMSGVFLGIGAVLMVILFAAVAAGENTYECMQPWLTGVIGRTLLLAWTAALYLHLANGVRHLIWDAGVGFDKQVATRSGVFVVIFTVVATILTWWFGYAMRGQ